MKSVKRYFLFVSFLLPGILKAQNENFQLVCPLNDARLVPPPKNAIKYTETDYCIVLVSDPDSVVKAVYNGRITNIEFDEETKNGVVMYARINNLDYYFWYTGLNKLIVRRNEIITAGQPLGFVSPGNKIELLMYQFETPIDPLKYLNCQGLKGNVVAMKRRIE